MSTWGARWAWRVMDGLGVALHLSSAILMTVLVFRYGCDFDVGYGGGKRGYNAGSNGLRARTMVDAGWSNDYDDDRRRATTITEQAFAVLEEDYGAWDSVVGKGNRFGVNNASLGFFESSWFESGVGGGVGSSSSSSSSSSSVSSSVSSSSSLDAYLKNQTLAAAAMDGWPIFQRMLRSGYIRPLVILMHFEWISTGFSILQLYLSMWHPYSKISPSYYSQGSYSFGHSIPASVYLALGGEGGSGGGGNGMTTMMMMTTRRKGTAGWNLACLMSGLACVIGGGFVLFDGVKKGDDNDVRREFMREEVLVETMWLILNGSVAGCVVTAFVWYMWIGAPKESSCEGFVGASGGVGSNSSSSSKSNNSSNSSGGGEEGNERGNAMVMNAVITGVALRFVEYVITAPELFVAVVCLFVHDPPFFCVASGCVLIGLCNLYGLLMFSAFVYGLQRAVEEIGAMRKEKNVSCGTGGGWHGWGSIGKAVFVYGGMMEAWGVYVVAIGWVFYLGSSVFGKDSEAPWFIIAGDWGAGSFFGLGFKLFCLLLRMTLCFPYVCLAGAWLLVLMYTSFGVWTTGWYVWAIGWTGVVRKNTTGGGGDEKRLETGIYVLNVGLAALSIGAKVGQVCVIGYALLAGGPGGGGIMGLQTC